MNKITTLNPDITQKLSLWTKEKTREREKNIVTIKSNQEILLCVEISSFFFNFKSYLVQHNLVFILIAFVVWLDIVPRLNGSALDKLIEKMNMFKILNSHS